MSNLRNVRSKIDCRWANQTPLRLNRHTRAQFNNNSNNNQPRRVQQIRVERRSQSVDQLQDFRTIRAQRQLALLGDPRNFQGQEIVQEYLDYLKAAVTALEFLNDQRTGSNKYDQLDNIFDHIINKTNEIREKAQSAERDETGL